MNTIEKLQEFTRLQKEVISEIKKTSLWSQLYKSILDKTIFPSSFSHSAIKNKDVYPYMSGSGGTYGHAIEYKSCYYYDSYTNVNSYFNHKPAIRFCIEVGYIDSDDDSYYHEMHTQNRTLWLDFPIDLLFAFSEKGWSDWMAYYKITIKSQLLSEIENAEKTLKELKNTFDNLSK